ncbi:MAG: PilZ domain-containing protein [Candidatus Anammoxibacter sp.]
MIIDAINKRRYPRVSTSFPCAFSNIDSRYQMMDEFWHGSQPCQNEIIIVTATILNLSEDGIFADNIIAFNPVTGKEIDRSEIIEHNLYNLKFRLNDNPKLVRTRGEYVRLHRERGRLCAAIRFKGISKDSKEIIREYIDSQVFDHNGNVVTVGIEKHRESILVKGSKELNIDRVVKYNTGH